MNQLTLAQALRDEGIQRADDHADPDWKDAALEAVHQTALALYEFIVDDVWERLGSRPAEGRAMGAVMKKAVSEGWIEATNLYKPSVQPQCHANPRRVWRSKVWVR